MSEQSLSQLDHKSAASFFRWSPSAYRSMGSAFFADLAERCADDAELMELADHAAPGQPYTFMFFGAVQSILLANRDDALAPHFGLESRPPVADDATFAALKDFCRRRRDEILPILKQRTVQYTLPVRASYVVPLFGHLLRKGAREPFSLVEVGCSAGLLTVFDHYFYDFGALGQLGDPANPHIRTASFSGGAPPVPTHMPRISERFGVDLNPVDLTDIVERHWIEALIAPDKVEELNEVRGALDVRARIPFETIKGDALEVTPALIPTLKDTPVIFHSVCLYQWPPELQNRFHESLLEASRGRTIYRLGADYVRDNPVRPADVAERGPLPGMVELFCVVYRDGEAEWEFLGVFDGSRRDIDWRARQFA